MKRLYKGLSLIAVLMLPVVLAGCNKSQGEAVAKENNHRERVVNVTVVEAKPTPIKDVMLLPGASKPWMDVRLAADKDGMVEWIGPREGDFVKKDELVAKIDVSMLKAQLDNAAANYKLADDLYQRRKKLFARKIISREELEQSLTQRTVAQGTVRQSRVQYEQGFVRSPIDGVVNYLHVDAGEFVGRGGPIADLVNVEKIKIEVNVPELDVNYLKKGGPAMFRVDAIPNRDFSGVIDYISLKADPATKTFLVRVLVDNQDKSIRPGMIVRMAMLRRVVPNAIVAPLFALVDKGGERVVFVEKDGVAHSRTVEIGIIEGDIVQITKGLEIGDRIIVTGQNDVEEGVKVLVQ